MRISALSLVNFKSHPETNLDFAKLTVIRSKNAVGKSSIEQAIQLALAGRADGTASDGKGSIGLIRKGESKSTVKVLLEDAGQPRLVQANLSGTSKNIAVIYPNDEQWPGGEDYANWLHENREVLSCLVNNRYFVELPEDKQKDVLSAILLPSTYEWPSWVKPAANSLVLKIDWKMTPFEIIDQAYDAAYKERTAINRDVKNFKVPEGDTSKASKVEEITGKLDERKKELEKAVSALAYLTADRIGSEKQRTAVQQRLDAAKSRVEREEASVTRLDGLLLSAARLKASKDIASGADKASQLEKDIARIGAELRMENQKRDKLKQLAGMCPTCFTPITEELVDSIMKPTLAEIGRLYDAEVAAIAERKKLGDPAASARQVAEHEQAAKDMEAAKGRAADERKVVAAAQKELDALPKAGAVADYSAEEEAIAELRQRVATGSQILSESKAAADLLKRKESANVEREALTKKQEAVDKLVRYFGDEVKAELLAGAIEPFAAQMNSVLANWGYTCELSIEPYRFALTFGGEQIEIKHLSKSQRYRFGVAFQVALAITTGFGFVVVDEGDIFFGDVRTNLFKALRTGALEQAIVLVADDNEKIPNAPGTAFWMLENESGPDEIPTTFAHRLTA